MSKSSVAIYPGSFDPFTTGHLNILKKALLVFDTVILGVGVSETKKEMFSPERRVAFISKVVAAEGIDPKRAKAQSFCGLTVGFAQEVNASHIVRGVRNSLDYIYEQQMAFTNAGLNEKIQTMFLPSSQDTIHISSTLIRSILSMNGDLKGLVHPVLAKELTATGA